MDLMHDLVLSGALTGLLISAVFGLTAAILGVPLCAKFLISRFKLTGASKAAKAAFLEGIRSFLAVYAGIVGVMSATLYIVLEVLGTTAWVGWLVLGALVVAIIGAVAMVKVRGSFMKKEVLAPKPKPKPKVRTRR